jgi:hypothetical protein
VRPLPPRAACESAELFALAESVGIHPDPKVFGILLELVRRDVKTSVIVQVLRGMKDAKIRAAISRQGGAARS